MTGAGVYSRKYAACAAAGVIFPWELPEKVLYYL